MEKKTAKEIIAVLEESGLSVDNYAYGDFLEGAPSDFKYSDELDAKVKEYDTAREAYANHPGYRNSESRDEEYEKLKETFNNTPSVYRLKEEEYAASLGLGKIVEVDNYGGEDQGSTWYTIKHFVDHDVYIRTDGWYTSYHGTDFNDGFGQEVFPAEKTVKYFATAKEMEKS